MVTWRYFISGSLNDRSTELRLSLNEPEALIQPSTGSALNLICRHSVIPSDNTAVRKRLFLMDSEKLKDLGVWCTLLFCFTNSLNFFAPLFSKVLKVHLSCVNVPTYLQEIFANKKSSVNNDIPFSSYTVSPVCFSKNIKQVAYRRVILKHIRETREQLPHSCLLLHL